jgi:enoyl-CoA hydratase/carnithine racemase
LPDLVNLEKLDGIGEIILNSPPANALGDEFLEQLQESVRLATEAPDIRSVLFRSEVQGIFMAGADLKKMLERSREDLRQYMNRVRAILNDIEAMPQPTIAVINGHALGGGCELTLCCDFRFMCGGKGRIGLPEVNLGIMPAAGGTRRLPRLIGMAKSRDIIMMGAGLTGEEALGIGLIDRVYEPGALLDESRRFAGDLAGRATRAIAAIKACLRGTAPDGEDLDRFLSLIHDTEDAKEGVKAFNERRTALFRGF